MRYHGEAISKPKPSFKNVFEEEKRENLNFKRQESNPFEEEGIELVHNDLRLDIQKPSSKEELANIADISKQEKQPSAITKFWHRITQLF